MNVDNTINGYKSNAKTLNEDKYSLLPALWFLDEFGPRCTTPSCPCQIATCACWASRYYYKLCRGYVENPMSWKIISIT